DVIGVTIARPPCHHIARWGKAGLALAARAGVVDGQNLRIGEGVIEDFYFVDQTIKWILDGRNVSNSNCDRLSCRRWRRAKYLGVVREAVDIKLQCCAIVGPGNVGPSV